MRFSRLTLLVGSFIASSTLAYPTILRPRAVDPKLVPDFGIQRGFKPTGTGDCEGFNGIKIPCGCPPDRASFLRDLNANIDAGRCVNNTSVKFTFPTDNSLQSQISRITGVLITLQNLRGPGVGCPAVSTNLLPIREALQKQLSQGGANANPPKVVTKTVTVTVVATPSPKVQPKPAPTPSVSPQPKPAPTPSFSPQPKPASTPSPVANQPSTQTPGTIDSALIARLAPDLGFQRGLNPTGTGDCDGAIPGGPKIPCSCPPDRPEFLRQLEENVRAGFAVRNPTVKISFPLDDSNASKRARITASVITLQNLKGPGVGCPLVSTTLAAQAKLLTG